MQRRLLLNWLQHCHSPTHKLPAKSHSLGAWCACTCLCTATAVRQSSTCAGKASFTCCSSHMQRQSGQHRMSSGEQLVHLLAMPAESNFSGVRYDPSLVPAVQTRGLLQPNGIPLCPQAGIQVSGWHTSLCGSGRTCTKAREWQGFESGQAEPADSI